jgi:VanZ family protein
MYKIEMIVAMGFFSFIVWIIFLADTGGHSIFFDLVRTIPYGDKIGHFFLFGILTATFIVASRFKTFSFGDFTIYYGTVVVSIFVLAEEISQGFIPSRTLDIFDLMADSVGIIGFTYISYLLQKTYKKENDKLRV